MRILLLLIFGLLVINVYIGVLGSVDLFMGMFSVSLWKEGGLLLVLVMLILILIFVDFELFKKKKIVLVSVLFIFVM